MMRKLLCAMTTFVALSCGAPGSECREAGGQCIRSAENSACGTRELLDCGGGNLPPPGGGSICCLP